MSDDQDFLEEALAGTQMKSIGGKVNINEYKRFMAASKALGLNKNSAATVCLRQGLKRMEAKVAALQEASVAAEQAGNPFSEPIAEKSDASGSDENSTEGDGVDDEDLFDDN